MKTIILAALLTFTLSTKTFAGYQTKINRESAAIKMTALKAFDVKALDDIKSETAADNQLKTENQLPVQAKRSFAKMFEGYEIKQATHFTGVEGEGFYISAENEKESIIVRIDETLDISIYKKSKK